MENILEARGVSKEYGGKYLFENISFSVKENEMIAIMGISGSGKTTFMNILGLIEKPTSGKVYYNNIEINLKSGRMIEKLLRENIGFLFQGFALINEKTVYENLLYAITKKRNSKNMRRHMIHILSKVGLRNCLDEKVFCLSGGEQQRVAIARLLLKECDIIFADEPTGSLDEISRNEVLLLLKKLQEEGKTIVIVTHDMFVGESCDRIVRLEDLIKRGE